MKTTTPIAAAALMAFALANTVAADDDGLMKKLEALQGDWMLLDENGDDTGILASTFELTSAGSVLMERMFPGSEDGSEMLNVYHADGDRVLMTHYCAAGNQPRMEILSTDNANRLELRFESITNLSAPESDHHMHQAEYIFHGDDRLTTRWQSMKDGKLVEEHAVFELKRKK